MAVDRYDGRRGIGTLLRDLAEGSATLVRDEVRLARIETAQAVAGLARGIALVATGAVFALLGTLALFTGLVLLVGDQWLPRDLYWLAALIVVVLTGALTAWFVKRGLALLAPRELAPDQTIDTLRETKSDLVAAVRS
jgi:uncharacterized membrane protein YqjE